MKNMKSMAMLAFAALLATSIALSSCEKDDDQDNYASTGINSSSGSSSGGGSTSGGSGSGSSKTTITKTTALRIQTFKVNGTFQEDDGKSSWYTIYKKELYGKLYVYTDPACINLLGYTERNKDRTRGGYIVSSYTYRIFKPYLFYHLYYYFN